MLPGNVATSTRDPSTDEELLILLNEMPSTRGRALRDKRRCPRHDRASLAADRR